jgi:glucose/arabinose dehydrogenase
MDVSARLVALGVLGPGTYDERGFLGVAFHPDYQYNGLLYTYTSEPNADPVGMPPTFETTLPDGPGTGDHQNVVAEWQAVDPADPAAGVDPASRRELMRVDWPQLNHDAGDMTFGPNGMLHIAMGDGGGADDRDGELYFRGDGSGTLAPIVGHGLDGNGQKLSNSLGKILRIDVDGSNSANGQYGIPADNPFVGQPDAVEEIYAYGLRNPFRISFDWATGELYAGNVGQNDLEEVERIVSGGNYGWPVREGTKVFNHNDNDPGYACDPDDGPFPCPSGEGDFIDPIAQYDTHGEGHSVLGGFVYWGSQIPQLQGRYVFGDFSAVFNLPFGPNNFGRLFYLAQKKTTKSKLLNIQEFKLAGQGALDLALLGWGQDAHGELYVMGNINGVPFGNDGVIQRIAPVSN